ncbi:MAG: ABC transporter substrate-binding protein [Rhodospirillaceae bacterium]
MKKLLLSAALMAFTATGAVSEEVTLGINAASVTQLDPHVSTKLGDKIVFGMMFNGLVRFAPGSMSADEIEPDLAESWTRSDDGLTWTFKLKQGVQFHGGYGELTAEDVVYSIERAADPDRSGVAPDYAQL